jgi:hypothetical protein
MAEKNDRYDRFTFEGGNRQERCMGGKRDDVGLRTQEFADNIGVGAINWRGKLLLDPARAEVLAEHFVDRAAGILE